MKLLQSVSVVLLGLLITSTMTGCGMAIEHAGDELERAMALFPDWPENDFEALAILLEEVGETANALLETKHAHKCPKFD